MKERLKKLRKALDLTQQEFADRIGISRGNIATHETRDGSPGNSVINLICREFNVNETWLRTGAGEMFVEAPSDTLDALVQNEKQWAVFHDFAMEVLESLSDGPAASSSTPVHTPAKEEEARAEAEPAADIASELAELKRQNQEMAAEIAAMKEEDAIKAAQSPSVSTGSFDPAQRAKK